MKPALEILIQLLKDFEGCRLKAYQDVAGIWTIGYGETKGVKAGDVWTQEYAEEQLSQRAAQFLNGVLKRCPQLYLESENRKAACASLAYNIGVGAFGASSVCRKTMRTDYEGAADSFLLWKFSGGREIRGLLLRRRAEQQLYLT